MYHCVRMITDYKLLSCFQFHRIKQSTKQQDLHCVRKKETKIFSAISPIKIDWFWWNLVHRFLNKFAAKWCKRFPPHLNNVSTLFCETWNAHCVHATIGYYRMVAYVRWAFQVSQGSVETLFRWGGKRLYHFAANSFGKRCTKFY